MALNKPELLDCLSDAKVKIKKLIEENNFLIHQQAELKAIAEKSGSEKAEFKTKCIIQEEEINKLNSMLKSLKVINDERKKLK